MFLPFLQISLAKPSFKGHVQGKGTFHFGENSVFFFFLIILTYNSDPNTKCYGAVHFDMFHHIDHINTVWVSLEKNI